MNKFYNCKYLFISLLYAWIRKRLCRSDTKKSFIDTLYKSLFTTLYKLVRNRLYKLHDCKYYFISTLYAWIIKRLYKFNTKYQLFMTLIKSLSNTESDFEPHPLPNPSIIPKILQFLIFFLTVHATTSDAIIEAPTSTYRSDYCHGLMMPAAVDFCAPSSQLPLQSQSNTQLNAKFTQQSNTQSDAQAHHPYIPLYTTTILKHTHSHSHSHIQPPRSSHTHSRSDPSSWKCDYSAISSPQCDNSLSSSNAQTQSSQSNALADNFDKLSIHGTDNHKCHNQRSTNHKMSKCNDSNSTHNDNHKQYNHSKCEERKRDINVNQLTNRTSVRDRDKTITRTKQKICPSHVQLYAFLHTHSPHFHTHLAKLSHFILNPTPSILSNIKDLILLNGIFTLICDTIEINLSSTNLDYLFFLKMTFSLLNKLISIFENNSNSVSLFTELRRLDQSVNELLEYYYYVRRSNETEKKIESN